MGGRAAEEMGRRRVFPRPLLLVVLSLAGFFWGWGGEEEDVLVSVCRGEVEGLGGGGTVVSVHVSFVRHDGHEGVRYVPEREEGVRERGYFW